jgi:hypothetical protein
LAGGVEDGSGCWFLSAQGESCNQACANASLVYDPATATHAGSGGTLANCVDILALLGADSGTNMGDLVGCAPNYIGCWVDSSGYGRCPDPVTDGPSAISGFARACACQEP